MFLKCPKCPNSDGTVEIKGVLYECACATLKRVGSKMPPYIRKAEIKKSHTNLPLVRNAKHHYYILASWEDMKAIIKSVMLLNSNRYIRITSDREIRDVYVGSKSRKSLGDETESEVINSLEQLMDQPYIVIVKVNELFYKNKAAAGALEEAISYRLEPDKPIWVFCDRNRPFGKGSISWSASVEELLETGFDYIDVPAISAFSLNEGISPIRAKTVLDVVNVDDEDAIAPSKGKTSNKPKSRIFQNTSGGEHDEAPEDEFEDIEYDFDEKKSPLAQYGSGVNSGKSKKKKPFGNQY